MSNDSLLAKDADVLHSLSRIIQMAEGYLWFKKTCCPNPGDRMWDSENKQWFQMVAGSWVRSTPPKIETEIKPPAPLGASALHVQNFQE